MFQSPHFSHNALDLCFHLISSLNRTSLISFFKRLISSALSSKPSMASSCWSWFLFIFKVLLTFPKTLQFQRQSCSWQLFSLSEILYFGSLLKGSHASSITSLHLDSLVHIASKKNLFLIGLWGCLRCKNSVNKQ